MKTEIPGNLVNKTNESVFQFVLGKSAHSDISEKLLLSIKELGNVNVFCPDYSSYQYVAVSTDDTIFGLAIGMNIIAYRQNPILKQRALLSGAKEFKEIGNEWVSFELFRNDWPEPDLTFWALKAYVFAKESTSIEE
jgi:hypothetical protein